MSDWNVHQKNILYNPTNFMCAGFVDCWNIRFEDNETLPSKALAFMLVGRKNQKKYPMIKLDTSEI